MTTTERPESIFRSIYESAKMPVLVCARDENLTVLYMNGYARLAFSPLPKPAVSPVKGSAPYRPLSSLLSFVSSDVFRFFRRHLLSAGFIENLEADVLTHQGAVMPVSVYGTCTEVLGGHYCILHLPAAAGSGGGADVLTGRILEAVSHSVDPDEAIRTVLALFGNHIRASRVYVFEENSPTHVRNSYEWCLPHVPPSLHEYQNLRKEDIAYPVLTGASGVFFSRESGNAAGDPLARDREILDRRRVKSLAVLPLAHAGGTVGFLGADDCEQYRAWTLGEIQLLRSIAHIIGVLIRRRDILRSASLSNSMIQTVTDNLEDLVYISDLDDYRLKFISKALAKAVGHRPEEILGRPCWSVLHRDQRGPCSFCPIPKAMQQEKNSGSGRYVWELHNNVTGRWYMVKDSIIDWIDGCRAHLGSFVDITYRKQYEERLKRFAATDAMTDVYNRKWGFGKLGDLFQARGRADRPQTLCFIDIDGLKCVNDRLGHAMGDEMIQNIVRVLFSCIRKDDFVCRWGGDEFILFLNCSVVDAEKVLDKIHFGLEHLNATAGKPYRLSVSTGMVDFAGPYAGLDQLIAEADRLMYEAKMKKKGTSCRSML